MTDQHGGHEVEAGKYHVELVVKDQDLSLYVRDQADKATVQFVPRAATC